MTITGKYHLTVTEKRHIREILANGWLSGSTRRKRYELQPIEGGFSGKVYTLERDDYGRPIERCQRFMVAQ